MANTIVPPPSALGLGLGSVPSSVGQELAAGGSSSSSWATGTGKWVALGGVATLAACVALYVVGTAKVRVKKDRVRNTDYAPPPPFARPGPPPPLSLVLTRGEGDNCTRRTTTATSAAAAADLTSPS
jgi:hypothetical protein